LKCKDVKVISLPHFDGLSLKELLSISNKNPEILNYLPEEQKIRLIPRDFVINVRYPPLTI